MDPQQRMILDCFSEALGAQHAYREPIRSTGVFVGVSQLDYARIAYSTGSALNTYYATGAHLSVTSGGWKKGLAGYQFTKLLLQWRRSCG